MRADECNPTHTRFTVFVNGANCGQLCMRADEATSFHQIVSLGCCDKVDEFRSSGKWILTTTSRPEGQNGLLPW